MSDKFKPNFKLNYLVFAAHPDDAEICCGGLLAKASQLGQSTGIVDLSRGELGTRGSVETRKEEAQKASHCLGLSYRKTLHFPDGSIPPWTIAPPAEAPNSLLREFHALVGILREQRPEVVIIPHIEERHPDHRAASELLSRAIFTAGLKNYLSPDTATQALPKYIPHQVLYYQMRYEFKPSFLVDISAVYQKKREAIACYNSQLHHPNESNQEEQTLLSNPLSFEALEIRDRYYGAMIGVTHAEAYLSHNILAIANPLQHFRESQQAQPQFFRGPFYG